MEPARTSAPRPADAATRRRQADFFDRPMDLDLSAANGFSGGTIERRAEARTAESVAAAVTDPRARAILFQGEAALIAPGPPASVYFSMEAVAKAGARGDFILLGYDGGVPVLAATLPGDPEDPTVAGAARDLRSIALEGMLSDRELGALALGRSLTHWHARHRFCANCGSETAIARGGFRRDCPACGTEHFPRTDPVAIMLAVDGDRCLLGRAHRFPPNFYSCLAGFLEPGETIEAAVRREILEEAGIATARVRYHSSQPWPFPSSLMIACHAEAISTEVRRDEAELADCRWFGRSEVAAMLAHAHPDGLRLPPPFAVAHHLIRSWAEYA